MSETPSAADTPHSSTETVDGRSGTSVKEPPSRTRRVGIRVVIAIVCYALTLSIRSDSLFFLAIPGFIGLVILVILAVHAVMCGLPKASGVPYATDGSDAHGVVKYHYSALFKRYTSILAVCAVMIAAVVTTDTNFLFPFMGVGIVGIMIGMTFWGLQFSLARRCRRVLRVYPLEFRAPVTKGNLRSQGRRTLRMGSERNGASPLMSARDPMLHDQWPNAIADGVWFAGDDAYGGVLLVPGTGELMCMQPREWEEFTQEREQADAERAEKAKRAGLTRHTL